MAASEGKNKTPDGFDRGNTTARIWDRVAFGLVAIQQRGRGTSPDDFTDSPAGESTAGGFFAARKVLFRRKSWPIETAPAEPLFRRYRLIDPFGIERSEPVCSFSRRAPIDPAGTFGNKTRSAGGQGGACFGRVGRGFGRKIGGEIP
jgi:hypothetical protein